MNHPHPPASPKSGTVKQPTLATAGQTTAASGRHAATGPSRPTATVSARPKRKSWLPWISLAGVSSRAWVGSFLLHTSLLISIAILWKPVIHGTGNHSEETIGLTLSHEQQISGIAQEEEGGGNPDGANAEALADALGNSSTSSSVKADAASDEALGSLAEALSGLNISGSEAGSIGGQGISGPGTGGNTRGNGTKSKTSFMGIEGQGNSFVYVVDNSGSMAEPNSRPMYRAKNELSKSIQSLGRVSYFQIIFYNNTPVSYLGSLTRTPGLIKADDIEIDAAKSYIQNIVPVGGTEHYPALLKGLQMKPDVLFFLTDGADPSLKQDEIETVTARAQANGTTIHAIQFGVGANSGDGYWIDQLARRTGGKFNYVDVSTITE